MTTVPASPPPGGEHPLLAAIGAVERALSETDVHDPAYLTTAEKEQLLRRQQRVLDHLTGRQARLLAAAPDVADDRATRSTAHWLAHQQRLRPGGLVVLEKVGRRLAPFTALAEASTTGEIGMAHTVAVLESLEALPAEVVGHEGAEARAELVAKAEAHLVAECAHFTPPEVRALGRRILEVVAPDAADDEERRLLEQEERRAVAATSLHLTRLGNGLTRIHGQLPDHDAAILRAALDAYANPRRSGELRESGGGVTSDPTGEHLSAAQLRGRAFCALLEHLPTDALPTHGGTPVAIVATLSHDALAAQVGAAGLDTGDRLSATAVRRLACQHGLLPAVLGGAGEVLDLGRRRRLFATPQRIAHAIAHPTCQAEGCTVAAAWTEAHHRQSWTSGGTTDRENLVGLCWTHHHKAHDSRYRATLDDTGTVRFHRRT